MLDTLLEGILDFYGIPETAFAALVSFFAAVAVVFGIVFLVLYFFKAAGLYRMAENAGLKNGWLAFVPVANSYVFGKVAEKYIRRDMRRSEPFGMLLTLLNIIMLLFAAVVLGVAFRILYLLVNESEPFYVSAIIFPFFLFTFIFCGIGIAYTVIKFIALWRIFAIFDYQNATMFTVLTYFFGFLEAIFIFAIRNKEPKYDYNARIGFNFNDF